MRPILKPALAMGILLTASSGLLAAPAWLERCTARVTGGYGLSLNSMQDQDTSFKQQSAPMSQGIDAGIEGYYDITPDVLSVGLGVYPIAVTRPERRYQYRNAKKALVTENADPSATFVPVMVNVELKQPVARHLDAVADLGLGVAPSTQVYYKSETSGDPDQQQDLNAALAIRFYIGLRESIGEHLGILLGVQDLTFDQAFIGSYGTNDFNQLAPELSADWSF
jgi:hypothetical protein